MTDLDPRQVEPATNGSARVGPAGRRPAVPEGLAPLLRVLVLGSAVVLALLAAVVWRTSRPNGFDDAVRGALHARWHPGTLAYAVDGLVAPVPVLLVVAALVVLALWGRCPRLSFVAVGPLLAYVVTSVLKPVVGRTIHGADNLSFPSGHTAYATSVGLVLGLVLVGRLLPGRRVGGVVVLALGVVAGVAMGVDQIVLDAHYPSDAVGGCCVGIAVVAALALATDAVADRWATRADAGARA